MAHGFNMTQAKGQAKLLALCTARNQQLHQQLLVIHQEGGVAALVEFEGGYTAIVPEAGSPALQNTLHATFGWSPQAYKVWGYPKGQGPLEILMQVKAAC